MPETFVNFLIWVRLVKFTIASVSASLPKKPGCATVRNTATHAVTLHESGVPRRPHAEDTGAKRLTPHRPCHRPSRARRRDRLGPSGSGVPPLFLFFKTPRYMAVLIASQTIPPPANPVPMETQGRPSHFEFSLKWSAGPACGTAAARRSPSSHDFTNPLAPSKRRLTRRRNPSDQSSASPWRAREDATIPAVQISISSIMTLPGRAKGSNGRTPTPRPYLAIKRVASIF